MTNDIVCPLCNKWSISKDECLIALKAGQPEPLRAHMSECFKKMDLTDD